MALPSPLASAVILRRLGPQFLDVKYRRIRRVFVLHRQSIRRLQFTYIVFHSCQLENPLSPTTMIVMHYLSLLNLQRVFPTFFGLLRNGVTSWVQSKNIPPWWKLEVQFAASSGFPHLYQPAQNFERSPVAKVGVAHRHSCGQ